MKQIALVVLASVILMAAAPAPIVKPNFPAAATTRDGSHDFDFEYGTGARTIGCSNIASPAATSGTTATVLRSCFRFGITAAIWKTAI